MITSKTKIKVVVFEMVFVLICIAVVYWAYVSAPRKSLYCAKDISMDAGTLDVFPVYKVFYKWDGRDESNPRWIIFKSGDMWRIANFRADFRFDNLESESINSEDFTYSYVENVDFNPELSRKEYLLYKLGFDPACEREKETFYRILRETSDFE
ncbi:MAG: hypothetical protein JW728_00015 [Candidatus Aureabacteria bacterium]|nr:hypothetical protein [Candidatus Auribacterota bacterium]